MTIRQPAVAGMFYPDDPEELRGQLGVLFARAREKTAPPQGARMPLAIIAPHAGYRYSGELAASAVAQIPQAQRAQIRRVVMVGPAHRVAFVGLATSGATSWRTPLGEVELDQEGRATLLQQLDEVHVHDAAHGPEHGLEVLLPFLQQVLEPGWRLLPLLTGRVDAEVVERALRPFWGCEDVLVVISSDLSHFFEDSVARSLDAQTAEAIEAIEPEALGEKSACGRLAIQGMLRLARQQAGSEVTRLMLANSADAGGARDSVVGYGAWRVDAASE